ncbi:NAD(P)H-binding protein [Streptomyces sp. NPDC046716]|uniref:NAD(P)H-binding protein n=1 Tax=Streptomyces sp. NPDC046716 TaxID=3157093 RepID=UPI0033CD0EDC
MLSITVTGATGNVGQPLLQALAASGRARVTAVSRREPAAPLPEGTGHRAADLTRPETLGPAFDGAEALFLHDSGADAHRIGPHDIVGAAKAGGVRRIVLLSSQGVETRPDSASHGGVARALEDAVRGAGLDWTVLRPGGFASNAWAWAESVRLRRTVAAPFGDVGLPVIDPADIAEVAAAALLSEAHAGRTYVLTGPAPTTPRERAAAIGAALGEPVRFVEQTRAEARAEMLAFLPEPVVETTLDILGAPNAAEQRVGPDVERVLGRPARTFAQWAERNAAAFR